MPFLFAGIFVFLPVVLLCVVVDSYYYGISNFPVLTAYNFFEVNVTQGLSKYFGTEPFLFYMVAILPLYFTVAFPSLVAALYTYPTDMISKAKQQPYMFY